MAVQGMAWHGTDWPTDGARVSTDDDVRRRIFQRYAKAKEPMSLRYQWQWKSASQDLDGKRYPWIEFQHFRAETRDHRQSARQRKCVTFAGGRHQMGDGNTGDWRSGGIRRIERDGWLKESFCHPKGTPEELLKFDLKVIFQLIRHRKWWEWWAFLVTMQSSCHLDARLDWRPFQSIIFGGVCLRHRRLEEAIRCTQRLRPYARSTCD